MSGYVVSVLVADAVGYTFTTWGAPWWAATLAVVGVAAAACYLYSEFRSAPLADGEPWSR